jgi:hypothetical protein
VAAVARVSSDNEDGVLAFNWAHDEVLTWHRPGAYQLADPMVVIGVSGVKDRSKLCLAWEFGLGGTRWHGVGIILDDVR